MIAAAARADRVGEGSSSRAQMWAMYKKQQACYWTAEELDLAHDHKDWAALTDNERYFLTRVLAFFAASDGIVNENLLKNFAVEVKCAEARSFYAFQAMMENIHVGTARRAHAAPHATHARARRARCTRS